MWMVGVFRESQVPAMWAYGKVCASACTHHKLKVVVAILEERARRLKCLTVC